MTTGRSGSGRTARTAKAPSSEPDEAEREREPSATPVEPSGAPEVGRGRDGAEHRLSLVGAERHVRREARRHEHRERDEPSAARDRVDESRPRRRAHARSAMTPASSEGIYWAATGTSSRRAPRRAACADRVEVERRDDAPVGSRGRPARRARPGGAARRLRRAPRPPRRSSRRPSPRTSTCARERDQVADDAGLRELRRARAGPSSSSDRSERPARRSRLPTPSMRRIDHAAP